MKDFKSSPEEETHKQETEAYIAKLQKLWSFIEEERKEKENARFETLVNIFKDFLRVFPYDDIVDRVYLSEHVLRHTVTCYFDSIYRFKIYAKSARADKHKQAAYLYKWIAKTKPIQILPPKDEEFLFGLNLVNAFFATHVALTFLLGVNGATRLKHLSESLYDNLIYQAHYRNISGRSVATQLCAIELALKNGRD